MINLQGGQPTLRDGLATLWCKAAGLCLRRGWGFSVQNIVIIYVDKYAAGANKLAKGPVMHICHALKHLVR